MPKKESPTVQPQSEGTLAIVSLVFGVVSLTGPGLLLGIPAIVTGVIALKEKNYDDAIAHLGQANQQDPQVVYWTALAWKGKGDAAKAKELGAKAANANLLPLVTYAFIREDAKKMAGG